MGARAMGLQTLSQGACIVLGPTNCRAVVVASRDCHPCRILSIDQTGVEGHTFNVNSSGAHGNTADRGWRPQHTARCSGASCVSARLATSVAMPMHITENPIWRPSVCSVHAGSRSPRSSTQNAYQGLARAPGSCRCCSIHIGLAVTVATFRKRLASVSCRYGAAALGSRCC